MIELKQSTVKIIEEKFRKDINQIQYEIYKNKSEINRLAEKQKQLKDTKKGLYDILRLIKK